MTSSYRPVHRFQVVLWDTIVYILSESRLVRRVIQQTSRASQDQDVIRDTLLTMVFALAGLISGATLTLITIMIYRVLISA